MEAITLFFHIIVFDRCGRGCFDTVTFRSLFLFVCPTKCLQFLAQWLHEILELNLFQRIEHIIRRQCFVLLFFGDDGC